MANVNSVQETQTVGQVGSLSNLSVAWGTYEYTAAASATDTVTFFTLPAGTTVHAGWLTGDDLDTGTETLEIDVGDASDPDRFLDSGVITGDAFAAGNIANVAGINYPLYETLKDGPYTYTSDTAIIGTIVAAANAGGTGTISLTMLCTYNDPRVSPPTKPL